MRKTTGASRRAGLALALAAMAGTMGLEYAGLNEARAAEPPPPQSEYFVRPGGMLKVKTRGFSCASEAAFNKANGHKYGGNKAGFDAMFASRDCSNLNVGDQYKLVSSSGGLVYQLAPVSGANVWSDPYFFEPAR